MRYLLPPPRTNDVNKNLAMSSNLSNLSFFVTESEEPLANQIKNKLTTSEKFFVQSNISSKSGNGSLTFTSESGENNSFLPENIEVNSGIITYRFDSKEKSSPLDQKFIDLIKKVKDDRGERENKLNSPKINWSSLTSEEVNSKFKEKGYQVISLGNDRYEISRQFKPIEDINNILQIKMIFNSKTGMSESSELYKDGKKVSENILEKKDGKTLIHKKFYGINSTRKEKNLIITNGF